MARLRPSEGCRGARTLATRVAKRGAVGDCSPSRERGLGCCFIAVSSHGCALKSSSLRHQPHAVVAGGLIRRAADIGVVG
jgi:hypothetical protein